jgi:hypothetical protein
MRHYVIKQDTIEYHLDSFVDDKTGFDTYRLSYSTNGNWSTTVQGKTILTISDTGNGYAVEWESDVKKRFLDYQNAREFHILISFIQKQDPMDDDVLIVKHDEFMRV